MDFLVSGHGQPLCAGLNNFRQAFDSVGSLTPSAIMLAFWYRRAPCGAVKGFVHWHVPASEDIKVGQHKSQPLA
eukprot:363378-Chlamydomonas_euryale.AAC.37